MSQNIPLESDRGFLGPDNSKAMSQGVAPYRIGAGNRRTPKSSGYFERASHEKCRDERKRSSGSDHSLILLLSRDLADISAFRHRS